MNTSLKRDNITSYLLRQIENIFPDGVVLPRPETSRVIGTALERLEHCFRHIQSRYYSSAGAVQFNHLNSDQYAAFLYLVSRVAYESGFIELAERSFYLNKALNGLDLFYAVRMPDIFLLVHPVGTVIGNGEFSDYLVIYQNVTIGSDKDGIYPAFMGENVLYSGCSVIGKVTLGKNCIVGANAFIRKSDNASAGLLYAGAFPHNKVTEHRKSVINDFFMETST